MGRLSLLSETTEECMDFNGTTNKKLTVLDEEQHKDIHVEHSGLLFPFIDSDNTIFHFSVIIPPHYHGSIPTPPPNFIA
jgi:hypothetical protein